MQFFVGSYTRMGGPGIAVCHWENGVLTHASSAADLNNPIYVITSQDQRYLYAVGDLPATGEGAVASYTIQADHLILKSIQSTGGRVPCYLTLSSDERYLYTADYISGSISVLPITDGYLQPAIQKIQHMGRGPHVTRQEAPHPHQCLFRPDANELFVCDLGIDRVMIYQQNPATGLLTYQDAIMMPGGMGPRHLVFADQNHGYVVGELDNMVRRIISTSQGWRITEECSSLPADFAGENTAAAIKIHENALWVSNRGHDSLCRIDLSEHGVMHEKAWLPSHGHCPRDFAFVSEGPLFANQDSGTVIAPNGECLPMPGAVCICLIP